eukprot:m.5250 g.5250  ORF g.5250 m.5250 type:complete len:57 (+) comp12613_c0_seq1:388-558(+)
MPEEFHLCDTILMTCWFMEENVRYYISQTLCPASDKTGSRMSDLVGHLANDRSLFS